MALVSSFNCPKDALVIRRHLLGEIARGNGPKNFRDFL